ncbi:VanZ family protein [Evansella cellulosilytica DSM 2522]|uniref:VanZ family protein n=1 Tax=Evansella cellulosilytica (strain ATCC 21833 / DSM 2522 / FERM P-1141 / JCM 9156 / N-4) TaxID=649639 RepID=E6U1P5_EVAC2|nr:VanZ family protein [Evansella cellulosilytica]ADU30408.1 VanZ family protein [Evansella cellulosilytica DSM 2522]
MGEKTKKQKGYPFAGWLLFIYLIVLLYITLFAWNYGASLGNEGPGGRNYNLSPFYSIYRIYEYGTLSMKINILLGNVLLFVPFGFLLPFFRERFKTSKKAVRFMPVVFLATILSFFIEINQFIFTQRVANVDDVILNTSGAVIGFLLYRAIRGIVTRTSISIK